MSGASLIPLLIGAMSAVTAPVADPSGDLGRTGYQRSVLALTVTYQTWDEDRPWLKRKPETRKASAVMIDSKRALTTAHVLENATLLQTEILGRVQQVHPRIERIDRTVNLALIELDETISHNTEPVPVADRTPTSGTLRTVRWRGKQLESAASRVISFEVERAATANTSHAFLRMRTDLGSGGWAEPVFSDDKLVAITVSQAQDESRAIPAEILKQFLDRNPAGANDRGFATLGVNWQVNSDSALSRFLRQAGDPKGVLVRQVPWGSTACGGLMPRDILLELNGQEIDAEGYYHHPWLGRIRLEQIIAERTKPGDTVSARVLRAGRELDVVLEIRTYPAALDLVPLSTEGAPPYLIVGGLVIRELDVPYLRTWGKDWLKDAPDSLVSRYYYDSESQTSAQRRIVLITSILPSAFNVGYHDLRDVVVTRVNGSFIGRLEDIADALRHPIGGFHVIDLAPEADRGQIVLSAAGLEDASSEILEAYSVPSGSRPREGSLPEGGGNCVSGD